MIRVFCACGRAFKAEDRHAGRRTKCPECGAELTIGPAPNASSSGGDTDDVPAWWHPSNAAAQSARGTAPTRSGSDPGTDGVNTMVLPAGYDPKKSAQAPGQSPPASTQGRAQATAPKAPIGAPGEFAELPPFPVKKFWAISAGTIAFSVLVVGALVWLRSPTPGMNNKMAPAPRATELGKPDDLGTSNRSPPSMPGHDPKPPENGIASGPTSAAAKAAPSGVHADGAGQPTTALAAASRRLRLLVPVYIYPAGDGRKEWQRLFDAASKVEIVAIANPNSGPGDERNLDYAAIFTEASNQGITLVGYVSTDYGRRTLTEIKNDADRWIKFYPQIRGFFFDQQPRERQHAANFAELRDYVKRKLRDPFVITNPGVPCDEAYLAQGVSDVTCVFVNFEGFERFELPATLKAYDPCRFAAMPYNIADVTAMRSVVKDTIIKRIGYIYISDAKPPNQWDKLPVYWEAEVDAVSRLR